MRLITCHSGKLQSLLAEQLPLTARMDCFTSGLEALDAMAPGGAFARGAVHELLSASTKLNFQPMTICAHWAHRAATSGGAIFFLDMNRQLYPPALAGMGLDLSRVYLLRPQSPEEAMWAMTECLRCHGVSAVVGEIDRLSMIEARRLQLAAETGGGVGLLLRPARSRIFAAATRWFVQPATGQRTTQCWKIQLIHGHGGCVGQSIYVEYFRETNSFVASAELAHRPGHAPDPKIRVAG